MAEYYIHNGDKDKTLAALHRAAAKATGKARRVIQGLAEALNHNNAARGRKEKGVPSMAKKDTKKATAKATAKRNPSTLANKVKDMDITGIVTEGVGVAAGSLALSFVDRQAERLMPNMNPLIRTGISTALVAGGAAYFSGGKGFLRSMAIGGVAAGVTQMASALMPNLFGGVDDYDMGGWTPDGTWSEELGYAEDGDEMAGILYDRTAATPAGRSF